jgi:hypothetical protein
MKRDRVIEPEHGCLERLMKSNFNMQLNLLRSINTATKKRRALKRVGKHSVPTKSSASASG